MNQTLPPRWLALAVRIYSMLLILYPADYRREYGELMIQFFRDVTRSKYDHAGLAAVSGWWCRTLFDLVLTVLQHRRKVNLVISKSGLSQSSWWLLALGGTFTALAAFSQLQPGSHLTYQGIYQVLFWLLVPGYLLVGIGSIGLALRYADVLGRRGQYALYLGSVGAILMAGAGAGGLRFIWLAGITLHTVGLIGFGLLHLWQPVLPVFRALPLQMAPGWIVIELLLLSSSATLSSQMLSFLFFAGMGLAWLGIGQSINRQQAKLAEATA